MVDRDPRAGAELVKSSVMLVALMVPLSKLSMPNPPPASATPALPAPMEMPDDVGVEGAFASCRWRR